MKPILCVAVGVVSLSLLRPCSSQPKSPPILSGDFDCKTGAVRFSAEGLGRRRFADLDSAAQALKGEGYAEEGVDEFTAVLQGVCRGPEWAASGDVKNVESEIARGFSMGGARRRATPPGQTVESTIIRVKKKGEKVEFKLFAANVPATAEGLAEYLATAEKRKGCRRITPKPPCFKCPDGTGFCVGKKLQK